MIKNAVTLNPHKVNKHKTKQRKTGRLVLAALQCRQIVGR